MHLPLSARVMFTQFPANNNTVDNKGALFRDFFKLFNASLKSANYQGKKPQTQNFWIPLDIQD